MPKVCAELRRTSPVQRPFGVLVPVALLMGLVAAPAWAGDFFGPAKVPQQEAAEPASKPAVVRQQQTRRAAPVAKRAPPSRRTPPPKPEEIYHEGEHYARLQTPQPSSSKRIEVIEFFWYGCPHCALFEPILRLWVTRQPSDVRFSAAPAVWRDLMKPHARAYYTAKALGRLDDIHEALFSALAMQQQPLHTASALADFFVKAGVPRADFERAWSSFSVARSPVQAEARMRAHAIGGTPAMIIAGTYQVRASRDMEEMLRVVDYLVAHERYERYVKGEALRERARQAAAADAAHDGATAAP